MYNLDRMTKTTDEIAHLFDVVVGKVGNAARGEVYPGRPGFVVAGPRRDR